MRRLDCFEVARRRVPSKKRRDENDDFLLARVIIGTLSFHGFESELDVLRVTRVQIVHDQVTFRDVSHRKIGFRTLEHFADTVGCV